MKSDDVKLQRLFAAARQAPEPPAAEMPPYLQTRILAHWRAQSGGARSWLSVARLLRLGLAAACGIMLACIAWTYRDLSHYPDTYVELANVRANADLLPP